jgi:hypothetical protein
LKYDFCKTSSFFVTKISLEPLSNMLMNHSGRFQNFEFKFLAGIVSNTWGAKIQKIGATVTNPVPVRLDPGAMLVESPSVEPSPLCPDPDRRTWRRRGRTARTPLSVSLLPA